MEGTRNWGWGEMLFNGYRVPVWEDEKKILEMDVTLVPQQVHVVNATELYI